MKLIELKDANLNACIRESQRERIGSALDEFNAAVKQAEDELVGAAVES